MNEKQLNLIVDYWDQRYEEMIYEKMEEVLCDDIGGE